LFPFLRASGAWWKEFIIHCLGMDLHDYWTYWLQTILSTTDINFVVINRTIPKGCNFYSDGATQHVSNPEGVTYQSIHFNHQLFFVGQIVVSVFTGIRGVVERIYYSLSNSIGRTSESMNC
jgi:hypothetical protein